MNKIKIQRIYIGDFGILRNQILDNISPNIVVIGGLNRAGKTTFFNILRCLGYGFSKGKKLPPFNTEYFIECDVNLNKEEIFNIKLQGFRQPEVTCLNGNRNLKIEDIYTVDRFTYEQLFTISLDELNVLNKKDKKINSLLLGAGFKNIIEIPNIIQEFKKEANRIGGKYGNPNTKMFKVFNSSILDAVKLKEDMLNNVTKFIQEKEEFSNVEKSIENKNKEIEILKSKVKVLDILKSNYELYSKGKRLNNILEKYDLDFIVKSLKNNSLEKLQNLKEEYKISIENYNENIYIFQQKFDLDIYFKDKLLFYKNTIKEYYKKISGFKEKILNYNNLKSSFQQEKRNIYLDINCLNENLKGDIKGVLNIKSDILNKYKLFNYIQNYKEIKKDIKDNEFIIKDLENKKYILNINNINKKVKIKNINNTKFYIIIFSIYCILLLFSFKSIYVLYGLAYGIIYFFICIFVLAIIIYFNKNFLNFEGHINNSEMKDINNRISQQYKVIYNLKKRLKQLENVFDNYRVNLKLSKKTSLEGMKEYLKSIESLKKRILEMNFSKENMLKNKLKLEKELKNLMNLLYKELKVKCNNDFMLKYLRKDIKEQDFKGIIVNSDILFYELEKIFNCVKLAEKIQQSEYIKTSLEKKIIKVLYENNQEKHNNIIYKKVNLLNEIDKFIINIKKFNNINKIRIEKENIHRQIIQIIRIESVRKEFYNLKFLWEKESVSYENDKDFLKIFDILYNKYVSLEEVKNEYNNFYEELVNLEEELENLKKDRQSLKESIDRLMVSEKLYEAQRQIDSSRKELRVLAEKYAVLNTGAFILQGVYDKFIEDTKEYLLKDASEIFKSITSGEYKNIEPPDNLYESDFKTILNNGKINNNYDMLSRATKEQLFFAMRLSRIKNINSSLPIVLDDSLVNFDIVHMRNSINILKELSKTHQVFIFTCHSNLIEYINKVGVNCQFWKLHKGKIEISTAKKLIEYLT